MINFERGTIWWKAFRFHFTSASFMPGILGGMIAWTMNGQFLPGYFLLVMLGLILNHLALNMTDDYYDFHHLVDVFATDGRNPYSGGSGLLSAGLIQPRTMRRVFIAFYAIAIGIGVFLGMMRGAFVLLLLAIGFFCAFFYTAPPIKFGYRGLGEITQLLCFGPGIGLGAYYVQTQKISLEAFWGTLPFGIMLFSMITINEIPDYFEDRKGGKLNLVARFGRKTGVWLFILSLCSAYGSILAGVILGRIPTLGLVSLLTLPIAFKTISILKTYYEEPVKMSPANLGMICIHNFTAILLIVAYFITGFRSDALIASFLPVIVLVILYIPIARLIGRTLFPWIRDEIREATIETDIVKSSMKNRSVTYRKTMKTLPLEGGGNRVGVKDLTGIARRLRKHSTDTERHLWRHLRDRQIDGSSFVVNNELAAMLWIL